MVQFYTRSCLSNWSRFCFGRISWQGLRRAEFIFLPMDDIRYFVYGLRISVGRENRLGII